MTKKEKTPTSKKLPDWIPETLQNRMYEATKKFIKEGT